MWNDWFKPALVMLMKFGFMVGVLSCVWVSSALYHERFYSENADGVIRIRVRDECLRPDWVKTELNAREYDVTARELGVVSDTMALLQRRTSALLDEAERVEAMRVELAQGKVKKPRGGVGGPAPSKR